MNHADSRNAVKAHAADSAGYAVRRMRLEDVDRVASVHVHVWREAYGLLMPADYLDSLDEAAFARRRLEQLTSSPEHTRHVVGLNPAKEIVAVGAAGPPRDDDAPVAWELWALNVLAADHGTGLADLLMADLIADRATYLWVLEGNSRARAFYNRYGFAADGAKKTHAPSGQRELRLVRGQGRQRVDPKMVGPAPE